MSELDTLSPDQRAVLQLLLKQGQSYSGIAGLLSLQPEAVRSRAHAALDSLGPDASLPSDRRAQIADYVLGQQDDRSKEATHDHLAESPPARAWARNVASALGPLGGTAATIPDERPSPRGGGVDGVAASSGLGDEAAEPAAKPARGGLNRQLTLPSSRRGGALLLAGLATLLVVLLIVLLGGGSDKKDNAKTNANTLTKSTPATTSTGAASAGGQSKPIAQINLTSPTKSAKTLGLAQVFQKGKQRALIVAGQGLPPGAYALWLYNSPKDARLLGFVPQRVGSQGRFVTQGALGPEGAKFKRLVISRETVAAGTKKLPSAPRNIVLSGAIPKSLSG